MKHYIILAAALATLSASMLVPAYAAEEAKVNLIATIENRPAFRPVSWTVYKIDNGQDSLVRTGSRHILSVDMKPGVYAAVAKADNHEKRYEFTVRANTPRDLVIPLD